ncbi:MAG: hypothetical protein KGL02_11300, partial [Acidobacteriota bacterium]|nr:hypothetical protein [Acidobacteriota bacterium]
DGSENGNAGKVVRAKLAKPEFPQKANDERDATDYQRHEERNFTDECRRLKQETKSEVRGDRDDGDRGDEIRVSQKPEFYSDPPMHHGYVSAGNIFGIGKVAKNQA